MEFIEFKGLHLGSRGAKTEPKREQDGAKTKTRGRR